MRVLLVDNHDSYTHNLAHLLADITGVWPLVAKNDRLTLEEVRRYAPEAIVLSPGPGRPDTARDVGIGPELIRAFSEVPTLGVCLGMQLIAHLHGAAVERAREPRHGRTSPITHDGSGLFSGIAQGFAAMRYHSLSVREPLPPELVATAHSDDGEIMALRHAQRPLSGVQFHPESVASEQGRRLLENFLAHPLAAPAPRAHPRPLAETAVVIERVVERGFVDPIGLFAALFAEESHAFLLHSNDMEPKRRGYSVLGSGAPTSGARGNTRGPVEAPFATGQVCIFDYEGRAPLRISVDGSICLDHQAQRILVSACGADEREAQDRAEMLAARVQEAQPRARPLPSPPSSSGAFLAARAQYLAQIARCQELIREGEAYELCLTNRFIGETDATALALYERLAALNPSPYAAYIRHGEQALVSSSPERYVRTYRDEHGALFAETRPIKGTRRRGRNRAEDEAIARDLQHSDKDRAENLMIVDVSRHDLGTWAEIGTVTTPRLLEVETHPAVFQLVSTVRAHLRPEATSEGVIAALFPPASMTGAPKERAMEWLKAIEGAPRGVYAGAFGYIDDRGHAELAVTIRSLWCEGRKVSFGTGGAILLDSVASQEWRELLDKARPLLQAVGLPDLAEDDWAD